MRHEDRKPPGLNLSIHTGPSRTDNLLHVGGIFTCRGGPSHCSFFPPERTPEGRSREGVNSVAFTIVIFEQCAMGPRPHTLYALKEGVGTET